MAEFRKPEEPIANVAARAMTHPYLVSRDDIMRMAARILDDQNNRPASVRSTRPVEAHGTKRFDSRLGAHLGQGG